MYIYKRKVLSFFRLGTICGELDLLFIITPAVCEGKQSYLDFPVELYFQDYNVNFKWNSYRS